MTSVLFTNVRIFDGTGTLPYPGEVLVQGNRISRISRGARALPTAGVTTVDGGGATLMPGLVSPRWESLLAATKLGGQIMMRGDELGQIREGHLADLLLVDGDPVASIAVLQDGARLLGVKKDGVFHKDPRKGPARGRFSRPAA
jgi:imidazolonepropionase-like amidohydrolase